MLCFRKNSVRILTLCLLLLFPYICCSMHERFISECGEKDPEVIFLGDCILETLQDTETWHEYFAPMHCLNFSIRGDRTENVLWRVENGELDNVKPKVIVLHVGTNNIDSPAEHIASGIRKICDCIRHKLPSCYIILPVNFLLIEMGKLKNLLKKNLLSYSALIDFENSCRPYYHVVSSQMICVIKMFL